MTAEPTFRTDMEVTYIDHMGTDRRVAEAAWTSTRGDRPGRDPERLIHRLARDGHTGTFEHNVLTVRANVPVFVARQWHRHRTQSFNEVSGRYVEMEPVFWLPGMDRPLIQSGGSMDYRRERGSADQWVSTVRTLREAAETAWTDYQSLLEHGVTKEVARTVLPSSLFTQFYATANLRNWLHFLDLRTDPTAQTEIREAAGQVEAIVKRLWPTAWAAWRTAADQTGTFFDPE